MNQEAVIAYAKVAIKNIAAENTEIEYILDNIETELFQLMDLYTEKEIIELAKYI